MNITAKLDKCLEILRDVQDSDELWWVIGELEAVLVELQHEKGA